MLDLKAIEDEYLQQCGPHDYGMVEYGCRCPSGDPRSAIVRLVEEVRLLRAMSTRSRAIVEAARAYAVAWHALNRYTAGDDLAKLADAQYLARTALVGLVDELQVPDA